jgi:hypothetical protein
MTATRRWGFATLLLICFALPLSAQQPVLTTTNAIVPPLVNFSGVLTDVNGEPLTGTIGVTFSLYKDQQGGAPLWLETQNVKPNTTGHYTVMLGSTTSQGIPTNIFASGEAHWLGVQVQGQAEKARMLLVSAPYALKARDAETLGGKPASAYMVATNPSASGSTNAVANGAAVPSGVPALSGGGTKDYVPLWLSPSKLGNSKLFQAGGKVGIGTITPGATLDVNGDVNVTTSYNIGEIRFAFGTYSATNAFLGFAGNTTMTGQSNTASGANALSSNTKGFQNTADGVAALQSNNTGAYNTAVGFGALFSNTTASNNTANGGGALHNNSTGFQNTATGANALYNTTTGANNTASGFYALQANTAGSQNTALGYNAGPDPNSTGLTNATAIGANAVVSESNALVLGGTGSNAVNVGIGTATPASTLDVHGTANITGNQTVNGNLGVMGAATISGTGSFIAPTGFAQLIVNSGGSGNTTTGAIAGNSSITSGTGGLFLAASNAVFAGNNTGLMFVGPNSGQWEQGPSSTGGPKNFMSIALNSTTTAAQNISFNTPTGVPVQTGRYGVGVTNTLDDGNNNMTALGWIWQKGRNYLQSNPANPAGTSSTSFTMMGLGSTLKLTPNFSGTVIIKIDSEAKNTAGDGNGILFQIFYGTGTAPSNGSSTTGTQVGPTFEPDFWATPGGYATVGFGTNLKITGLTVGTPYWFDIALKSLGSGSSNATIQSIEFYLEEI